MFEIAAPYPALKVTALLPNPQFSDGEGLTDEVLVKHAMDGTLYTYVKRKGGRRKLLWNFTLSRNKGLELRNFLYAFFASPIQVIDHHNRKWIGHFTNNPFEFKTERKGGPALQGWPNGDVQTISLEFEGIEQ